VWRGLYRHRRVARLPDSMNKPTFKATLASIQNQSESVREAVERMIADGDDFRDDEYHQLLDILQRSMIYIEDATFLFDRRFERKSPQSRKMVVKQVPLFRRTHLEQEKSLRNPLVR
jgi:hypothetical protein